MGRGTAGAPIGSVSVSAGDDDTDLFISINPGFLNAFLGGSVIFGGELFGLTATTTPEAIMGFTGPDIPGGDPLTPSLTLVLVPEPGAALLLAGAFVALWARRRAVA